VGDLSIADHLLIREDRMKMPCDMPLLLRAAALPHHHSPPTHHDTIPQTTWSRSPHPLRAHLVKRPVTLKVWVMAISRHKRVARRHIHTRQRLYLAAGPWSVSRLAIERHGFLISSSGRKRRRHHHRPLTQKSRRHRDKRKEKRATMASPRAASARHHPRDPNASQACD